MNGNIQQAWRFLQEFLAKGSNIRHVDTLITCRCFAPAPRFYRVVSKKEKKKRNRCNVMHYFVSNDLFNTRTFDIYNVEANKIVNSVFRCEIFQSGKRSKFDRTRECLRKI